MIVTGFHELYVACCSDDLEPSGSDAAEDVIEEIEDDDDDVIDLMDEDEAAETSQGLCSLSCSSHFARSLTRLLARLHAAGYACIAPPI